MVRTDHVLHPEISAVQKSNEDLNSDLEPDDEYVHTATIEVAADDSRIAARKRGEETENLILLNKEQMDAMGPATLIKTGTDSREQQKKSARGKCIESSDSDDNRRKKKRKKH